MVHEERRDHCVAAFTQASNLTMHMRKVHEGRRDHARPHCTAAFSEASGMRNKHLCAVHERCRDHARPHCAAVFSEAGNLTRHVRSMHPNNNNERTIHVLRLQACYTLTQEPHQVSGGQQRRGEELDSY